MHLKYGLTCLVTYRLSRMYYIAIKMTKLTNEFEEASKMEQSLIYIGYIGYETPKCDILLDFH